MKSSKKKKIKPEPKEEGNFRNEWELELWAFGSVFYDYLVSEADTVDLIESWNAIHGELAMLETFDDWRKNMRTIEKLYKIVHQKPEKI